MTEMLSTIARWWWFVWVILIAATLLAGFLSRKRKPRDHRLQEFLTRFDAAAPVAERLPPDLGLRLYRGRDGKYARSLDGRRYLVGELPSQLEQTTWSFPIWIFAGAFTALGLIGTFLGLQDAAVAFKSALEAANPDSSMEAFQTVQNRAVKEFIQAMGTAFGTSIVGLGTATLITLLYAGVPRSIDPNRRLLGLFHKTFEVVAPAELLYRGQEADLTAAANQLGSGARELAAAAEKLDSERMGRLVSTAIEQSMGPVLREISAALRDLHEQNRDQTTQVLERLIGELRDQVLKPMTNAVRQNTDQNAELRDKIASLVQELPKVTGAVSTSAEAMERFATNTKSDLSAFTKQLDGVLRTFTGESRDVFSRIPDQVKAALQDVHSDIQTMLQSTREAFEQQNSSFRSFTAESQSQMRSFTQESQQRMVEIRDGSVALMREQHANLQSIAQESAHIMSKAREELVAGIHVIPEMLHTTREESQKQLQVFQTESLASMDRFRNDYQQQLSEFFEKQSVALEETLGKQRDGLSRVVNELTLAYRDEATQRQLLGQRVDDQLRRFADTQGELQTLNAAMKTWMPQVGSDLRATQAAAVEHVSKLHSMLTQVVTTQNEQVELIARHHQNALENLAGTTEKMRTDLDDAVVSVCKNLSAVASMLVTGRDAQQQPVGSV